MVVYKLTNLINGKSYVGQTIHTVKERFRQHKHCKTSLIGKAIRKYGAENFSIEILAECETQEELDELEIFFIEYFDCMSPKGYNLTRGGKYKPAETKDNPKKKYMLIADPETGKIKGYLPLKKKRFKKDRDNLYKKPALWLAQLRLTGEQYSVLFILLGKLDFENYLYVTLKEIAGILGMQTSHVSRAMRKLKELEIILEGPPIGTAKTYRINPQITRKKVDTTLTSRKFLKAGT